MSGQGPYHPQLIVTSEQEVVVTRAFHAPQESVFEALTDCRQLERWFGPRGATLAACDVAARPGGPFRLALDLGAGGRRVFAGTFRELAAPSRLSCSCTFGLGGGRQLRTEMRIELRERDAVTLLTGSTAFTSGEDRDAYLHAGMARAGAESYDRLAEALAVDTTPATDDELVVARLLDSPTEEVFAAWTDPDRLARWWGPPDFAMVEQRLELRPGGRHLYAMRPPDGPVAWGKSVYREILPPERLVYLSSVVDATGTTARNPLAPEGPQEVLNTLTLFDLDGRTMLILRGRPEGASAAERAAFAAAKGQARRAFDATFARLQAHLSEEASRPVG